MVDIQVSSSYLTVSTFSKTVVLNYEEFTKEQVLDNHETPLQEKTADGGIPIITSAFSTCGNMFACCYYKTLRLWSVSDWKLIKHKTIIRSVSKIIFSPKSDKIIVCEKTGDVYEHSLKDFDKPGRLILGHVSVLLDILITEDEKFIVTCDRDEKIRVSHYPNSYNIESFCLGHHECVTTLNILPHDSSVLVSSSGDGTLIFWHYVSSEKLLKYFVENNQKLIPANEREHEKINVILKVCVLQIEIDSSLICALIGSYKGIFIHSVNSFNSSLKCELMQYINLSVEPLCLTVSRYKKLFILQHESNDPLLIYDYNTNIFEKSACSVNLSNCISKNFNFLDTKCLFIKGKYINSLYKKKFDNESLYLKRKLERLEFTKEKKRSFISSICS